MSDNMLYLREDDLNNVMGFKITNNSFFSVGTLILIDGHAWELVETVGSDYIFKPSDDDKTAEKNNLFFFNGSEPTDTLKAYCELLSESLHESFSSELIHQDPYHADIEQETDHVYTEVSYSFYSKNLRNNVIKKLKDSEHFELHQEDERGLLGRLTEFEIDVSKQDDCYRVRVLYNNLNCSRDDLKGREIQTNQEVKSEVEQAISQFQAEFKTIQRLMKQLGLHSSGMCPGL